MGALVPRHVLLIFVAACLATLASSPTACAVPPPPAAEHPLAAPPVGPGASPPPLLTAANCGLVRRANRTWVEFGPGMTIDDMVPAGMAAGAVVRALDAAVCALVQRGRSVSVLQRHGSQLKAQAADCGGFEVTRVLWQDAELAHARATLRGLRSPASLSWLATLAREDTAWKVETFRRDTP